MLPFNHSSYEGTVESVLCSCFYNTLCSSLFVSKERDFHCVTDTDFFLRELTSSVCFILDPGLKKYMRLLEEQHGKFQEAYRCLHCLFFLS